MTDECYDKFVYAGEPFSIAAQPGEGERPGCGIVVQDVLDDRLADRLRARPAAVVNAAQELQSHSTSNPVSISQKAAIEALRGPQDEVGVMLEEYRRRRAYVIDRIRRSLTEDD
jgi:aspartate aminotransferase